MLNVTKNFLKWQSENCKATLTPEQKRKARFKALILKQELVRLVDAKYQAELDADTEVSGSVELSGNLGWGSNDYHGDDEAPSGSVGNYGEIDMDGFQVVDCDDLSAEGEDHEEDQY